VSSKCIGQDSPSEQREKTRLISLFFIKAFLAWFKHQEGMQKKSMNQNLTKKEIVKTLVLSPLYLKLKLSDRAYLIGKLIPRK